jgi:hypothetical protein
MVNNVLTESQLLAGFAAGSANQCAFADSWKPPKVNPEKMAVVFRLGGCTL